MSKTIIKIAHRGASGYEPENTLLAFSKAIELGADMIELDVQLCKSSELVVIHDENVKRTTDGRGKVASMTLDDLKKLDAGKGERIPLLEEVIDLVDRRCAVNIELKGEGTALPTLQVINNAVSEKGWSKEQFILSSFSREELVAVRKADQDIKVGLNISKAKDDFPSFAGELNLYSIHPGTAIADKGLVDKIHSLHMKTFVWAADSPEQIKWLKDIGVDGIFSNYPDRL